MWNLVEPELYQWRNLYYTQARTVRARCQAFCADTRVNRSRKEGSDPSTLKRTEGATEEKQAQERSSRKKSENTPGNPLQRREKCEEVHLSLSQGT